jgi:hypothetical protein
MAEELVALERISIISIDDMNIISDDPQFIEL